MTYQTLKFYCNQGLVPNVKRDKNNRRVFDEHDVEWVKSLICLKKCGMSIDEMREYLQLCLQGEASIPQRKVMLAEKRARFVEQIAELEASVDYIDWKQGVYDDVLAGRTEYFSNLLPEEWRRQRAGRQKRLSKGRWSGKSSCFGRKQLPRDARTSIFSIIDRQSPITDRQSRRKACSAYIIMSPASPLLPLRPAFCQKEEKQLRLVP